MQRNALQAPGNADQLATLPLLELVLPGLGRPLQPVGLLLICVKSGQRADASTPPPPRSTQSCSRSLCVAVYCPHTGQVLLRREQVTVDEARLYRHPRHRKWAWDSR